MSDEQRSDLWGWLVPGLGLAAVGVVLSMNGAPIAVPMIVLGLILCIVGVARRQRKG